jgi:hypothetical protein
MVNDSMSGHCLQASFGHRNPIPLTAFMDEEAALGREPICPLVHQPQ